MTKLTLLLGLLMAANNISTTSVTAHPPITLRHEQPAMPMTKDEARFADLVNKERMDRGLSKLRVDPLLVEVARAHSREMCDKRYFSHTSPTPTLTTPLDRYLTALGHRPTWALVGENLFYCSETGVDRGHCALMNSKGHRDNILESRYERIGVGTYVNEKGEYYVTQMFLASTE